MLDVLLIEDDPGDELITREAFETNTVVSLLHVAHDGQEGLDFLYRRGDHQNAPRPNLILLDLNLPKYDGRQLLEQIKNDPDLCHIPVVILSTSSAQEDISRSYKLHANAYITKPVDLDQFMSAVRQIDKFFVQLVRLPHALTALCRCYLSCFEFAQGRAQPTAPSRCGDRRRRCRGLPRGSGISARSGFRAHHRASPSRSLLGSASLRIVQNDCMYCRPRDPVV